MLARVNRLKNKHDDGDGDEHDDDDNDDDDHHELHHGHAADHIQCS